MMQTKKWKIDEWNIDKQYRSENDDIFTYIVWIGFDSNARKGFMENY